MNLYNESVSNVDYLNLCSDSDNDIIPMDVDNDIITSSHSELVPNETFIEELVEMVNNGQNIWSILSSSQPTNNDKFVIPFQNEYIKKNINDIKIIRYLKQIMIMELNIGQYDSFNECFKMYLKTLNMNLENILLNKILDKNILVLVKFFYVFQHNIICLFLYKIVFFAHKKQKMFRMGIIKLDMW